MLPPERSVNPYPEAPPSSGLLAPSRFATWPALSLRITRTAFEVPSVMLDHVPESAARTPDVSDVQVLEPNVGLVRVSVAAGFS